MIEVEPGIRIADRELRFEYVRSSGPGGQNVNKTATKAVLRWSVVDSPGLSEAARRRFLERFATRVSATGDVIIASDRFRDQPRNSEDCLARLRTMLEAIARPPRPRRPTRPTKGARERRLQDKRERSGVKNLRGRVRTD